MADELTVLAPEVRTLARPASGPLLAARGVLQRSEALRAVCIEAKAQGWTEEQLGEALCPALEDALTASPEQAAQAALYLAAEFLQMGDQLLLVSRETGKAIGRVSQEDIWQPPPVPREDGTMAVPLPRIRPELEAFLYEYVHETAREAANLATLAKRTHQTAFLAETGDRRLRIVTRAGRRQMEEEMRGASPLLGARGAAQTFLSAFGPPGPQDEPNLAFTAVGRARTPLTDQIGINVRFDHDAAVRSHLATSLCWDMAVQIGKEAATKARCYSIEHAELIRELTGPLPIPSVCVLPPEVTIPGAGSNVIYVPGVRPYLFRFPQVGSLSEDGPSRLEGRDIFDRWDVIVRMPVSFTIDWFKVIAIDVVGVSHDGVVVER